MRLAIISDIHGNYPAFKAVVEDIQNNDIDQTICLGDVVTLGPHPKEVIELLKSLECKSITGNHESALLNMRHTSKYKIAKPVIPVLEWCKSKLSKDDLDFLNSFESCIKINFSQKDKLLCFHGSPSSNCEIISSSSPEAQMKRHFNANEFKYYTGGHSHIQMLRQYNGKLIINPGSVGIPFINIPPLGKSPSLLPWAEYAVVNYNKGTLGVDLRRVDFSIPKLLSAIKKSDMPSKEWWFEQYKN